MPDPRFKGQRREIAAVLNGQKLTLYETAKALGRKSGDIQKVVRQMHGEGILGPVGEEPTRGTEFSLEDGFVEALEDALRSDQIPGMLAVDQDLLMLRSPSRKALERVLARPDLTAAIAWAARLGANNEMLIAISKDAPPPQLDALRSALERAEIDVIGYRTADLMDAETMRLRFIGSQETAERLAGRLP